MSDNQTREQMLIAMNIAAKERAKRMIAQCAYELGIPAATLAGLRDGSLVAVPILGSTLMHANIARAHHMTEAQVAAIWRGCIATFHPDLMARAITEADTRAASILAASEAPRDE